MALFLLENRDFLDFRMIFILQLIHFMAIKNLQILVIDKNPNPNLWTVDVKYTIIKLLFVCCAIQHCAKVWKDLVEPYLKNHPEV
jgi:hypothetical protein